MLPPRLNWLVLHRAQTENQSSHCASSGDASAPKIPGGPVPLLESATQLLAYDMFMCVAQKLIDHSISFSYKIVLPRGFVQQTPAPV